ncbi:MAG: DoxX family protein [Acidobacteriota bacterium]|nr:DoxX family protein [Acidobacteriota bacterium]
MTTLPNRFTALAPKILGIMRFISGVMFTCYGAQKLFGAFGGIPPGAPAYVVYIAGTIELVGGALIAIGLLTRAAAFLSSGLMAAAYFMGHASGGFWPHANGGELAVLYCWLFLYIAAAGAGAFALDNLIWRKRSV